MKIIYPTEIGVSIITPILNHGKNEEDQVLSIIKKCVPEGVEFKIISDSDLPQNTSFRNAWEFDTKLGIVISLEKAKNISHEIRRFKREEEFAPFDEIIMKRIPGKDFDQAENERETIRKKYDQLQTQINNCVEVEELKKIMEA